jgi:hypothetical protein
MDVLHRHLTVLSIVVAFAITLGFAFPEVQREPVALSTLIREERTVKVDGKIEQWRLQWRAAPQLECPPAKDTSFSCMCETFAYGESGELDLIRLRDGAEVERLPLGPFYDVLDSGKAMLQRWPVKNGDSKNARAHTNDEAWQTSESVQIQKRPVVQIMKLADYNHDGNATEFYLPTTSLPCGKSAGVVVGVQSDKRFTALGTIFNPDSPVVLKSWQWDAVLKSSKPVTVMDWKCGDQGAKEEIEMELQATRRGVSVTENHYRCPRVGNGTLIRAVSW